MLGANFIKFLNVQQDLVVEYNSSGSRLSGSAWHIGKFVEKSTKLNCLEITDYRIKFGTMATRTSNQAWSKGLDPDACYK